MLPHIKRSVSSNNKSDDDTDEDYISNNNNNNQGSIFNSSVLLNQTLHERNRLISVHINYLGEMYHKLLSAHQRLELRVDEISCRLDFVLGLLQDRIQQGPYPSSGIFSSPICPPCPPCPPSHHSNFRRFQYSHSPFSCFVPAVPNNVVLQQPQLNEVEPATTTVLPEEEHAIPFD